MITPLPWASIGLTAAWQHRNAPVRLTSRAWFQASRGKSSKAPMAALRWISSSSMSWVEFRVEGGAVDQDVQPPKVFSEQW